MTMLRPNLTLCPPSDAVRQQKKIEDLCSLVLSQFQKYHPSRNLKFTYLGSFQRLKMRILTEKILSIFHKLNVTRNTLGCYGLSEMD